MQKRCGSFLINLHFFYIKHKENLLKHLQKLIASILNKFWNKNLGNHKKKKLNILSLLRNNNPNRFHARFISKNVPSNKYPLLNAICLFGFFFSLEKLWDGKYRLGCEKTINVNLLDKSVSLFSSNMIWFIIVVRKWHENKVLRFLSR